MLHASAEAILCKVCRGIDSHFCWRQITILESLVYSARLRFGKEVERHVVYAFVQEVGRTTSPHLSCQSV